MRRCLSKVININDSPPRFSQDTYETVLLLPTFIGVEVLRLEAFDPDMSSNLTLDSDNSVTPQLAYSLEDSSVEFFSMERYTGVVTVINQNLNKDRYRFNVKVSHWPSANMRHEENVCVCSRLRLTHIIKVFLMQRTLHHEHLSFFVGLWSLLPSKRLFCFC